MSPTRSLCLLSVPLLLLGGCTSATGAGLGSSLRGVFGGQSSDPAWGYTDAEFEKAAAASCGQHAAQHGAVNVSSAQRVSTAMVYVTGTSGQLPFTCNFRNDGQITRFRTG